jgi:hypothetical protein
MKNITTLILFLSLLVSLKLIGQNQSDEFYPEKIYLHLQKQVLVAGEPIPFKAYCINYKYNQLSHNSKVAYIDIVDRNNYPIAKQSIILINGVGSGYLPTNINLTSGQYTVNAYTNWGNSISKEFISCFPIYIFNNQSKPAQIDMEEQNAQITASTSTNWLPILNKLNTNTFLMKSKVEDLGRKLHLEVNHTDSTAPQDQTYFLELHSPKEVEQRVRIDFINKKWMYTTRVSDLKSHIYAIIIKSKNGKVHFESTLFKENPWNTKVIEYPRIAIKRRQTKSLSIKLMNLNSATDTLYLSASIHKKEPVIHQFNIIDFQNLYKYLKVESVPNFYQLKPGKNLWTSPSVSIPHFIKMESPYKVTAERYVENHNYVLEGTLTKNGMLKTLSNHDIYLSKVGEHAELIPLRTNQDGKFFFPLPLKSGIHDFALQVIDDTTQCSFILKEKHNKTGIFAPLRSYNWGNKSMRDFLTSQWKNHQVREMYSQKLFEKQKPPRIFRSTINFYDTAPLSTRLQDYVRLDSLSEYFHELIPHVKIKTKNNNRELFVVNRDHNKTMRKSPLILYDGLILTDADKFLSINPENIDRIEVVPYEYFYQNAHFFGIVHAITKSKKCEIKELPFNSERYHLPLFIPPLQRLEYQKPQDRFPDFRTDLLWKPDLIVTNQTPLKLEFISSDVIGEYELLIEGISSKGKPFVLKQDIIVE